MTKDHYRKPGWFTRHVFNAVVARATRMGFSVWGSRVLRVRGRKTGELHSVPVNLLRLDQGTFLVAPRGNTQWVRNLRVAGVGEVVLGRRTERFEARELSDDRKAPILREYLRRWKMEVGAFFDGVGADSSDEELLTIAPRHPVFEISFVAGSAL